MFQFNLKYLLGHSSKKNSEIAEYDIGDILMFDVPLEIVRTTYYYYNLKSGT